MKTTTISIAERLADALAADPAFLGSAEASCASSWMFTVGIDMRKFLADRNSPFVHLFPAGMDEDSREHEVVHSLGVVIGVTDKETSGEKVKVLRGLSTLGNDVWPRFIHVADSFSCDARLIMQELEYNYEKFPLIMLVAQLMFTEPNPVGEKTAIGSRRPRI